MAVKMHLKTFLILTCIAATTTNPNRKPRTVLDAKPYEANIVWTHSEVMDSDGDFILKWAVTDSSIVFRIEGRSSGYVGLGFNSDGGMKGADLVVAWVDDRDGSAHLLDCHGESAAVSGAVSDDTQNYELISGYQNETHTVIEMRRQLDTCDIQDYVIGDETVQVLWSLGPPGSDGLLPKHKMSGYQPLRLLQPSARPEREHLEDWNVTVTNISIPNNMASLFWCKVFSVPVLHKRHIVGYEPILNSSGKKSPVRHVLLYECPEAQGDEKQIWNDWADGDGFFGPSMPREWASCYSPVAVWASGSKGEYFPENVGMPVGGKGNPSFYMLEIHYDNRALHDVIDSSGLRLKHTSVLRPHDAGLLGSGVAVSALHFIAPAHSGYVTPGICSRSCTEKMLPPEGITIESVLLHAHNTAKKISLRHIRNGQELERIAEESSYDARYQSSRPIAGGRLVKPGDQLITECSYDSRKRKAPILGGYAAQQEMCISFMIYWPRTPLVGCYSMSSVKEFFETFGVKKFYNTAMQDVENMFLASGTYESFPQEISFDLMQQQNSRDSAMQGDDQGVALLSSLTIEEPPEFVNKTFIQHLNEIPWHDAILSRQIHESLFRGPHTLVCKKNDNTLGVPIEIQNYPNFTALITNDTTEQKRCNYKYDQLPGETGPHTASATKFYSSFKTLFLVCIVKFVLVR